MFTFYDFIDQGNEVFTLKKQIEARQLVHALLIIGNIGTGKRSLAMLLSAALLCDSDRNKPCGLCPSCQLVDANEHPDITVIEKGNPLTPDTAKGRTTIPVDDIREMIRICSQFSFKGKCRIIVIAEAGDLTQQAQNSLLKILEEPPQNTYFILTSSHPEQLLTTLKSRCRTIRMKPWHSSRINETLTRQGIDPDAAKRASESADGSIGRAIKLASDNEFWHTREKVMNDFFRIRKRSEILTISNSWKDKKGDADTVLSLLDDYLHRLFLFRFQGIRENVSDFPEEWLRFAIKAPLNRMIFLTEMVREAHKQITFNVNFQAITEQLLLAFAGEVEQWVR